MGQALKKEVGKNLQYLSSFALNIKFEVLLPHFGKLENFPLNRN